MSTSEDSVRLTTLPYDEPPSSAAWLLAVQPGADVEAVAVAMVARIEALENALMPFCQNGMAFSHARMNLDAAGNSGHPAGGTWVNLPEGVTFSKNETVFYNAIDVLGRARVHDYIMNIFEQTKQAVEAQQTRDQENTMQH